MNKEDFIKMMENGYNSLVREETLEEKSFRLGYTYALNDLFHIVMNNDKEIEKLNLINKVHEERIQQLSKKLAKRNKRIDKAIEYCESYCCWESEDGVFYESDFCIDDLIEILKGRR